MPDDVQDVMGKSLLQAQYGGRPKNAKALHGFHGGRILEISDDFDGDTYRCVYTVQFAEAVYVLHAFQKKSKAGIRTPPQDIDKVKLRVRAAQSHHVAARTASQKEE